MLVGLHGSNIAHTTDDANHLKRSGARSVKLWSEANRESEISLLRSVAGADLNVMVRLPGFPAPHPGLQDLPGNYARDCLKAIARFYPYGARVFQVDNEPNWTWVRADTRPDQYQFYMRLAVLELRKLLDHVYPGVRLAAPPLSFSPALFHHDAGNPTAWTLDQWLEAFKWKPQPGAPNLWQCFDLVSANCYWQYPKQMRDPSFGANFVQVHDMSGGLPVIITECANSLGDKTPRPSRADVEVAQVRDYPEYIEFVRGYSWVEALDFFLLGGSIDWAARGFSLTQGVCDAIKSARP